MIVLSDPSSYGPDVEAHMTAGENLIRDYLDEDRLRDERYERRLSPIREPNPRFSDMEQWRDELTAILAQCDALAFHYSRMTDLEVERVRAGGFQPTSLELLRQRLDAQVAEGGLTAVQAEKIYRSSPLHLEGLYGRRLGMFWLVSPGVPVSDRGVEWLLGVWGGESAYWGLEPGQAEEQVLRRIGRGRVFSVSMPLSEDGEAYKVADQLLTVLANRLGYERDRRLCDHRVCSPLGPERILGVLSEGDPGYERFAQAD